MLFKSLYNILALQFCWAPGYNATAMYQGQNKIVSKLDFWWFHLPQWTESNGPNVIWLQKVVSNTPFTYLGKVKKNQQLFLWAFFEEPHSIGLTRFFAPLRWLHPLRRLYVTMLNGVSAARLYVWWPHKSENIHIQDNWTNQVFPVSGFSLLSKTQTMSSYDQLFARWSLNVILPAGLTEKSRTTMKPRQRKIASLKHLMFLRWVQFGRWRYNLNNKQSSEKTSQNCFNLDRQLHLGKQKILKRGTEA